MRILHKRELMQKENKNKTKQNKTTTKTKTQRLRTISGYLSLDFTWKMIQFQ